MIYVLRFWQFFHNYKLKLHAAVQTLNHFRYIYFISVSLPPASFHLFSKRCEIFQILYCSVLSQPESMQHHLPVAMEMQKILHIRPVGPGRQHKMQQNASCKCRTCLSADRWATPSCNRHLLQHCKLHPSGWDRNYKLFTLNRGPHGKKKTQGTCPCQGFESWRF